MTLPSSIKVFVGLMLWGLFPVLGQFSSGSTGGDGALEVTTSTNLQVPPNGVFHFTTINIAAGAGLTFTRNALNTPVYLLATGDVVINGNINLDGGNSSGLIPGRGGPGGFDGGVGPSQGFDSGDGQGPGGGSRHVEGGLHAVYAFPRPGNSNVYGNTLLSPLIGGSGGGGVYLFGGASAGGGGGGGAILVASTTRVTVQGTISAVGGSGIGAGSGSGGAIRVMAPVVDGSGSLEVGAFPSPGRTRIDSMDRLSHRNITMTGKATRGAQMYVFPERNPSLDIVSAVGTPIPFGATAPVSITLPVGSDTNQWIRVQATGFTNDVPIRIKITPENAPSAIFDGVILQSSGDPAFADVQVGLPVDTVCHVHAWTR